MLRTGPLAQGQLPSAPPLSPSPALIRSPGVTFSGREPARRAECKSPYKSSSLICDWLQFKGSLSILSNRTPLIVFKKSLMFYTYCFLVSLRLYRDWAHIHVQQDHDVHMFFHVIIILCLGCIETVTIYSVGV